MDILSRPTLVLNRSWVAINTISLKEALKRLFGESVDDKGNKLPKVKILDVETWSTYDYYSWAKLTPQPDEPVIKLSHGIIRAPEIVITANFQRVPRLQLNFSRKNLIKRDQVCQYCGDKGSTIDHVIPKSKGGKNSWENCVLCCYDCNQKKKDMTPEEAGMKLLKKPGKPGLEIMNNTPHRLKSWEVFFNKLN